VKTYDVTIEVRTEVTIEVLADGVEDAKSEALACLEASGLRSFHASESEPEVRKVTDLDWEGE